jgi:hypothetical protein
MTENLPAPRNVTPLPAKAVKIPYAAFDKYAELAKQLGKECRELHHALQNVYSHCPPDQLTAGEQALDRYERFTRARIEKFYNSAERFDPEGAYDDDGTITKATASIHVSMLVGSFPNANPSDPEVYVKMLIEEVMAFECLTVTYLELAFRSIRRSAKFLPTISEVLEELKKQEDLWDKRTWDIARADITAKNLREKLDAEKLRRETETKAREERKRLANCPFSAGNAVWHSKFGDGTVQEVDGNKCTVLFDYDCTPKKVVSEFLEHRPTFDGASK